jgi:predicted transcriptional regulator of viral defense system
MRCANNFAINRQLWYFIAMNFREVQEIVGRDPVFESGLLLAGDVDPASVRRQLSRLTASGHLIQLRRGLYALAPPYRKVKPHPFLVANHIVRGSYVSLQSALAYHGLIPEHVPVVTSVTTSRPGYRETPLGHFEYHHIKPEFFYGYDVIEVEDKQTALVANPEKALLDLVFLQPGSDSRDYLEGLRLENLERLDFEELERLAESSGRPKLRRAAAIVETIVHQEAEEYEAL